MPDTVENPNPNPQAGDHPSAATPMAETDQSPPQSESSNVAKRPNISFSIWPPSDRTREAVRNRLVETLSSPSILSKRYGTVSREEAIDTAKLIEEEAFEVAGKATASDDDGVEILQVYSKEISKRMLEKVKARSVASEAAPETAEVSDSSNKPDEDAASSAPPESEKTESVVDDD